MCKNIIELIPQEMSDEAVFHLINALNALAHEIARVYAAEKLRHQKKQDPSQWTNDF